MHILTPVPENLSARGPLLFRGRRRRQAWRDGDVSERPFQLAGVESGAGVGPVLRGELEVSVGGPVGEDPNELGEVGLGVQPFQPAFRAYLAATFSCAADDWA